MELCWHCALGRPLREGAGALEHYVRQNCQNRQFSAPTSPPLPLWGCGDGRVALGAQEDLPSATVQGFCGLYWTYVYYQASCLDAPPAHGVGPSAPLPCLLRLLRVPYLAEKGSTAGQLARDDSIRLPPHILETVL